MLHEPLSAAYTITIGTIVDGHVRYSKMHTTTLSVTRLPSSSHYQPAERSRMTGVLPMRALLNNTLMFHVHRAESD